MKHDGNLTVTRDNVDYARKLTSVGGYLKICADNAGLTALQSVGGDLEIRANNTGLTALQSVSGKRIATRAEGEARLREVAKHALATDGALNMEKWHCGTAHCVAGWAIHLAGEKGYALESEIGSCAAGAVLLGVDAASLFFLDTEMALARLAEYL